MTPAAGSFDVRGDENGVYLFCPVCGDLVDIAREWPSIRDLIAAASQHARESHPLSVVPIRTGV